MGDDLDIGSSAAFGAYTGMPSGGGEEWEADFDD